MLDYNPNLAKIMQDEKTFIEANGAKIQIKSIPDDARTGVMDPREYRMALDRADAFTKMARPDASATPSDAPADPMAAIYGMRAMMGFANYNMNRAEIYTRYDEVELGGNKVGIWAYYPRRPIGKTDRKAFIYIHGGGWVGGSVFAVENPCRLLAERADSVVFNIDYALAPEKPFPSGFNDCWNALKYIYDNAESYGIDREKIGMGGDSAGGNLTACVAVKDRDLGTNMLKYQVLLYPAVTFDNNIQGYKWNIDNYEIAEEQHAIIEPGLNLGRPRDGVEGTGMNAMYLQGGEDARMPYISPVFAEKKGLCKCLIMVAEFDGLRVQGEYYGKLLSEAGVDTRVIRYKGVGHAFLDKLGVLPQAEDAVQEIANDLIAL